jgi:hypothetical protein
MNIKKPLVIIHVNFKKVILEGNFLEEVNV